MHVAHLPDTCITHVHTEQHVYTETPEFTLFKHDFPHTLIINYGQILYKIILGPFKHIHHQDY